jgi:hypothetical protein
VRRFLASAGWIHGDNGDPYVIGELDYRRHEHYVDSYGFADDSYGNGHVQKRYDLDRIRNLEFGNGYGDLYAHRCRDVDDHSLLRGRRQRRDQHFERGISHCQRSLNADRHNHLAHGIDAGADDHGKRDADGNRYAG